jgi:hypothetical protein
MYETSKGKITARTGAGAAEAPLRQLHREETGLPKNDLFKKLEILENQREVLVQDSSGNVYLLDIISGQQMQGFGLVNFDDQRKALAQPLAVTPWCSTECKLGYVSTNLDFPQMFECDVYASDAGFAASGPEYMEQKLNVGLRVCCSLSGNGADAEKIPALGGETGGLPSVSSMSAWITTFLGPPAASSTVREGEDWPS